MTFSSFSSFSNNDRSKKFYNTKENNKEKYIKFKLNYQKLNNLIRQQSSIMAWRALGTDNADLIHQLKGIYFYFIVYVMVES